MSSVDGLHCAFSQNFETAEMLSLATKTIAVASGILGDLSTKWLDNVSSPFLRLADAVSNSFLQLARVMTLLKGLWCFRGEGSMAVQDPMIGANALELVQSSLPHFEDVVLEILGCELTVRSGLDLSVVDDPRACAFLTRLTGELTGEGALPLCLKIFYCEREYEEMCIFTPRGFNSAFMRSLLGERWSTSRTRLAVSRHIAGAERCSALLLARDLQAEIGWLVPSVLELSECLPMKSRAPWYTERCIVVLS